MPGDFQAFYTSDLRPVLEELEGRRRKILLAFAALLAGIAAMAGAICLLVSQARGDSQLMLLVLAAAGGLMALAWWFLTKDFVLEFKQRVIAAIVRFVDPSLNYSPGSHVSRSRFIASRIFLHRIDRFRGEDHIAGTVGKTAIEFSELHAEYKTESTDSKGRRHTHWHTIFKGTFFAADFNKAFRGITVVLPDMAQRMLGFLGQKLQELNVQRGQLVKLEDPEFEKLFVVYGDDQVEARYILSTSLMKRIVDYRRKTGKQIYFAFAHSSIFAAISTGKNMFEPAFLRSLLNFETCRDYLEDLQLVLAIVEDLNLNLRIWTKA